MVILSLLLPNNTVQTFSGAKDSYLGRFYLWSVHLIANIVKAMFKLIFLSLIFTPCCKYTYSKNNVKFLKLTSSEISLKAKFTHFICAPKLIVFATFSSRTDQLKFCPGIQHDVECNLFTLKQRLFHVLTYMYIFLSNVR